MRGAINPSSRPLADAYLQRLEEVIVKAQEYAPKAIREKVLEWYLQRLTCGVGSLTRCVLASRIARLCRMPGEQND
jgi:hypothetical protein